MKIDEAFQRLVKARLEQIPRHCLSSRDPRFVANDIVRGADFQYTKHNFGKATSRSEQMFFFPVPGLPNDFNNEEACIMNGHIIFTRYMSNHDIEWFLYVEHYGWKIRLMIAGMKSQPCLMSRSMGFPGSSMLSLIGPRMS